MNPILHYPVSDPPFRRASHLVAPGRSQPAGFFEPGAVRDTIVWDDFTSPIGASGVDLLNARSGSNHNYFKHPSWGGQITFSDKGRVRHNSGSIGAYLANCGYMSDYIVSARIYFTAGWALSGGQVGIIARAHTETDTFYYLYVQTQNTPSASVSLAKRVSASFTSLGNFSVTSNWHTPRGLGSKGGYIDIAMVLTGSVIKVYVDGVERFAVNDSSIPVGLPGVYAFTPAGNATGCHLENFSVRRVGGPIVQGKGISINSVSTASQMYWGPIRAIRTNGAAILASATLPSVGNANNIANAGPVRFQWYRSTIASELPNSRTILRGQTSALLDDRSALPGVTYYYRCAVTDVAGNTFLSDAFQITTLLPTDKFVSFYGDSLTWSHGTGVLHESQDYPTVCLASLGAPWKGENWGCPSWADIDLGLFTMPLFAPYQFDAALAKNVAVYWEGTNTMLTQSGATAASRTLANCAYLKSLGYQVVLGNCIDRQQSGVPVDMATRISDYNSALLSGYAAIGVDAHVDLRALLPDSTNTTYFQTDKVHLTAAGYAVVAGAMQSAIASL